MVFGLVCQVLWPPQRPFEDDTLKEIDYAVYLEQSRVIQALADAGERQDSAAMGEVARRSIYLADWGDQEVDGLYLSPNGTQVRDSLKVVLQDFRRLGNLINRGLDAGRRGDVDAMNGTMELWDLWYEVAGEHIRFHQALKEQEWGIG